MPLPSLNSLLSNEENALLRMIRNLQKRIDQLEGRTTARTNFANAANLNVIVGTGDPFNIEAPFTGTAMLYPAFSHTSGNYHIIGMNAGVLQFGLSADDGTIRAGGGDVTIDQYGVNFANQEGDLTFTDMAGSRDTIVIYSDGNDYLVLKNAVGGAGIGFDIDDASHNVIQYSFTTDGILIDGVNINTGWIPVYATWTRTGNHVFTVSGDFTIEYRKGAKVRYKDGGSYEYGVIASSSHSGGTTTVTLITTTDYAMAATTITDTYLSYTESPEGFPDEFAFTPSGLVTIQNGTQEGYWKTNGNKIYLHGGVLYGSTPTTFSSSDLTLPVAIGASYDISAAQSPLGIATYLDAGTASYLGNIRRQTSTTARFQAVVTSATHGTTTAITSTVPFTWGNTDELAFFIEYLF
jgi:hypothetical protein